MPRNMSRMARMEIMRRGRNGGMDSRFRDRNGREHYDDGRFAPMRNDTNIEIEGRFRDDRGGERFTDRRGAQMTSGTSARMDYDSERYGAAYYPGRPFPVYRDDGMMRGGFDMNRIGFNANREIDSNYGMNAEYSGDGNAQNNYRMDAAYAGGSTMDHRSGFRMGGHAMGMDAEEKMTKEMAEKWVHSMKGADGAKGQYWTMDQAKQIMGRYGFQGDPVEWYVVLNMMKRDYSKAAAKMGVDKEEFYACMADAFLNDVDAQPEKLMRYYQAVVKK